MLVNIHVKNMALIREADIPLGMGLNILSGETGAGKSILMGAVSVALGMQGFKGFAREGSEYALSELVFTVDHEEQKKALEELDISVEENEVIISRKLSNGRSVSKINGETVPVSLVKKAASVLIDIHGQHENQALLHKKKHLEILDHFAGDDLASCLEEYKRKYQDYGRLGKKLEEAKKDEAGRAKEMDFLAYEIGEIAEAGLKPGEDELLEEEYRKLSNSLAIREAVLQAHELTGSDGASDAVGRAARSLSAVLAYDRELSDLYDQLMEVESLLSDFNHEAASYADGLEMDDGRLYELEERLDLVNRLKNKYGGTIESILEYQAAQQQRLDLLEDYDSYMAGLKRDYETCAAGLAVCAKKLGSLRRKAAVQFSGAVRKALEELNFLDVRFEAEIKELDGYTANGQEEICFMISTNPGQPLRPVQDTASGGELSRIMLAVKAVMADKEEVETLIFDEIDSGISGRTAQKVSEKLAVIAKSHQVICITHLAQIAAMADVHFMIEKQVTDQETCTGIRRLDEEESIMELARILGGAKITPTVLESAREMKELALCTKKY